MMGYYKSPEALVRFRRAGEKEGRGQQREDKEGICPALDRVRGPPHRVHLLRPELPSGQGHPLCPRPCLPLGRDTAGLGGGGCSAGARGSFKPPLRGWGWTGISSRFARAGDSKGKGDVLSARSCTRGRLDKTARGW